MILKIKKEISHFIKNNMGISISAGISILIVVIYVTSIEWPELWHNAGEQFEILYQLALAILSSVIFYIIQVYIPERKKKKAVRPYIIKLMRKIADNMNTIIKELSKCYLKQEVSISEITDEQLKSILSEYSPNDETTIQVAFELRNLSNAEMMDLEFNEIETSINKLVFDYIGFMDEESEILIKDIDNCKAKEMFFSKANILMKLFGGRGISGDAVIYPFKEFKDLYNKLMKYIEESDSK